MHREAIFYIISYSILEFFFIKYSIFLLFEMNRCGQMMIFPFPQSFLALKRFSGSILTKNRADSIIQFWWIDLNIRTANGNREWCQLSMNLITQRLKQTAIYFIREKKRISWITFFARRLSSIGNSFLFPWWHLRLFSVLAFHSNVISLLLMWKCQQSWVELQTVIEYEKYTLFRLQFN